MKYFQKITLSVLAIVVMALGNKVVAVAVVIDPTDIEFIDDTVYTGTKIEIIDTVGNGTSAAVLTGANTIPIDVLVGKIKVGDAAAAGAKLSTGANTVKSGGILEITAATVGCVPGTLDVESGGILQANVDVPSDSAAFSSTLKMDSGSVLKLGSGVVWGKNIVVGGTA